MYRIFYSTLNSMSSTRYIHIFLFEKKVVFKKPVAARLINIRTILQLELIFVKVIWWRKWTIPPRPLDDFIVPHSLYIVLPPLLLYLPFFKDNFRILSTMFKVICKCM